MEITFPWPPRQLNPNHHCHWRVKARFAKAYRHAWRLLALQAKAKVADELKNEPLEIVVTFHPPDRRVRDRDNCISSIKSGMDGLADALRMNDRHFVPDYKMSQEVLGVVRVRLPAHAEKGVQP